MAGEKSRVTETKDNPFMKEYEKLIAEFASEVEQEIKEHITWRSEMFVRQVMKLYEKSIARGEI